MFAAWIFMVIGRMDVEMAENHEYNHLRNTIAVRMREPGSWLRMAMQCSKLI